MATVTGYFLQVWIQKLPLSTVSSFWNPPPPGIKKFIYSVACSLLKLYFYTTFSKPTG